MIKSEQVLGVERSAINMLLSSDRGFIKNTPWYDLINHNLTSKLREDAEVDVSFKQIIPYLVIKNGHRYLTYSRSNKQTEARLHDKLSIGIGGHINPGDTVVSDVIIQALTRELSEEVLIELDAPPAFQGFINDDTTEVGRVHLGLVFLATSTSNRFFVKEFEKMSCYWASLEELHKSYERMESWSQIVIDNIDSLGK